MLSRAFAKRVLTWTIALIHHYPLAILNQIPLVSIFQLGDTIKSFSSVQPHFLHLLNNAKIFANKAVVEFNLRL